MVVVSCEPGTLVVVVLVVVVTTASLVISVCRELSSLSLAKLTC